MAQEALIARRAAVEEVERLLQHPEDLKRLASLRSEYAAKQQSNKAQLTAAVGSQVETTKSGLDMLHRAHVALLKIRENFALIDSLCTECQSLIDCDDKIQLLSAVHHNLRKTLQDVENIAALPVEAAEAEELLKDDGSLLQAYECLAILEGTSMKAQTALESGTQVNLQEAQNLNSYFQKVKVTMGKFEERLWSVVRNFLSISRDNPALLVTAVQIIELQELVDAELRSVGAGQGPVLLRKSWRRRCLLQISMCVQDMFAPLLQRCSQLIVAGENTDKGVTEILSEADAFVVQLADIYDYVTPCFPPDYHIFGVICAEYHRQLGSMVDFIGLCAENLANSDILKVMQWINVYQDSLAGLGVEENDVKWADGQSNGVPLLVGKYVERTTTMLSTWLANIVEGDFHQEPKVSSEGKMWSPGAVDFFRILNEQTQVVAEVNVDTMLLRTGQAAVWTMHDFQAAQRRHINDGLGLEMLCAVMNNNLRCYSESLEFAEQLEEKLADEFKGRLDIENTCRGFLELAKEAVAACVAIVFADPGFAELFTKLFVAPEWRSGALMGSVVATFQDFLQDFERMLEADFYRRLAEAFLEECVAYYLAAALTHMRTVNDDDLAGIRRDVGQLRTFFGGIIKADKVDRDCQPIADMCEFLTSDSLEAFVLSYTTLLSSAPGITPMLLANLITARAASDKNISKADVKEILEHCREVFGNRQALSPEQLMSGAAAQTAAAAAASAATAKGGKAPSGKDAAFKAAVNAARKRTLLAKSGAP